METLRHCLPPSVRRTLNELPESLDETYERILGEIKKPNREHAHRVLQCLVVAIRPLRVEELAEVFAVDFDNEGIPKLKPDWRWGDQEQALLTSCSSLIVIVKSGGVRIVQFSHFSVKEFLTSSRLGTSSGHTSRYHIVLEPAHTILAQACMSVLLRLEGHAWGVSHSSPLARYAAEHWVAHAQNENVSPCVRKAMEYLFDLDKPYFAAWLQLYDIDTSARAGSKHRTFTSRSKYDATPLYYAALCGFQDLVEHLTVNNPEQVNATGGYFVIPLVAALAAGHFQTAKFLHDNGAHPNIRGKAGTTPLLTAAYNGDFEMVRVLLEYKADVNARHTRGWTSLHLASHGNPSLGPNITPSFSNVAQLLLEHGADINAKATSHSASTPLHIAAQQGRVEVVYVLLQNGANVSMKDDRGRTALQMASDRGHVDVMKLLSLSEHLTG